MLLSGESGDKKQIAVILRMRRPYSFGPTGDRHMTVEVTSDDLFVVYNGPQRLVRPRLLSAFAMQRATSANSH